MLFHNIFYFLAAALTLLCAASATLVTAGPPPSSDCASSPDPCHDLRCSSELWPAVASLLPLPPHWGPDTPLADFGHGIDCSPGGISLHLHANASSFFSGGTLRPDLVAQSFPLSSFVATDMHNISANFSQFPGVRPSPFGPLPGSLGVLRITRAKHLWVEGRPADGSQGSVVIDLSLPVYSGGATTSIVMTNLSGAGILVYDAPSNEYVPTSMYLNLSSCGLRGVFDGTPFGQMPVVVLDLRGNALSYVGFPGGGPAPVGAFVDPFVILFSTMCSNVLWCEQQGIQNVVFCMPDTDPNIVSIVQIANVGGNSESGPLFLDISMLIHRDGDFRACSAVVPSLTVNLDPTGSSGPLGNGYWQQSPSLVTLARELAPCMPDNTLLWQAEDTYTPGVRLFRERDEPIYDSGTGRVIGMNRTALPPVRYNAGRCPQSAASYGPAFVSTAAFSSANIFVQFRVYSGLGGMASFVRMRLFDAEQDVYEECNVRFSLLVDQNSGLVYNEKFFAQQLEQRCVPRVVPCDDAASQYLCPVEKRIHGITALQSQSQEVVGLVGFRFTVPLTHTSKLASFTLNAYASSNFLSPSIIALWDREQPSATTRYVYVSAPSGIKLTIDLAATHFVFSVAQQALKITTTRSCRCDLILTMQQHVTRASQLVSRFVPFGTWSWADAALCIAEKCDFPEARSWSSASWNSGAVVSEAGMQYDSFSWKYASIYMSPRNQTSPTSFVDFAEGKWFEQSDPELLPTSVFCISNADFASSQVILEIERGRASMKYLQGRRGDRTYATVKSCPAGPWIWNVSAVSVNEVNRRMASEISGALQGCFPEALVNSYLAPPFVSISTSSTQIVFTDSGGTQLKFASAVCNSTLNVHHEQCPLVSVAPATTNSSSNGGDSAFDYTHVVWKPSSTASSSSSSFSAGTVKSNQCFDVSELFRHQLLNDTTTASLDGCYPACYSDERSCLQSSSLLLSIGMCYARNGVSPALMHYPAGLRHLFTAENFSRSDINSSEMCSHDDTLSSNNNNNNNSTVSAALLASVVQFIRSFNNSHSRAESAAHKQVKFVCGGNGEARLVTCSSSSNDNTSSSSSPIDLFIGAYIHGAENIGWTRAGAAAADALLIQCTPCVPYLGISNFPVSLMVYLVGAVVNVLLVVAANLLSPKIVPRLLRLKSAIAARLAGETEAAARNLRGGALRRLRMAQSQRAKQLEWELQQTNLAWVSQAELDALLLQFAKAVEKAAVRQKAVDFDSFVQEESEPNLASPTAAAAAAATSPAERDEHSPLLEEQKKSNQLQQEDDDGDEEVASQQEQQEVGSKLQRAVRSAFIEVVQERLLLDSRLPPLRLSGGSVQRCVRLFTLCFDETVASRERRNFSPAAAAAADDDGDDDSRAPSEVSAAAGPQSGRFVDLSGGAVSHLSSAYSAMEPLPGSGEKNNNNSSSSSVSKKNHFEIEIEETIASIERDSSIVWRAYELQQNFLTRSLLRPPLLLVSIQLLIVVTWFGVCIFNAFEQWNSVFFEEHGRRTSLKLYELIFFAFLNSSWPSALFVNKCFSVLFSSRSDIKKDGGAAAAAAADGSFFTAVLNLARDPFIATPFLLLLPPFISHCVPGIAVFLPIFLILALLQVLVLLLLRFLPEVGFEGGRPVLRSGPGLRAFIGVVVGRALTLFIVSLLLRMSFSYALLYSGLWGSNGWAETISFEFTANSPECSLFSMKEGAIDAFQHLGSLFA